MALSHLLRRAATTAVPLISRAARRSTGSCSALRFPAAGHFTGGRRFFASEAKPSSDKDFLKIIQSEIQCAKDSNDPNRELDGHDKVDKLPEEFPFIIEDNPGEEIILLKKEYHGESIAVEVDMPNIVDGDSESDDTGAEDDSKLRISLTVKISKGSDPCLVFSISGYPDEFTIDDLAVVKENASDDDIAYEGPNFEDLDENLQKGFHKYLEMRDIKPSTINFLYEYMINKDSREYLAWLEKLKSFVEK